MASNFYFFKKIDKELYEIIKRIVSAGYTDTLIIQDFIPGDDTYLYDAVAYVTSNHQVKLLSLAKIGLQEHSKNMVGNAAVLINGYTNGIDTKEIESSMKSFLEDISYQGFCEFDLKYDYRDKTFKVLEINARQGRSSYYINGLGYNLVKILIDDLIYHKEMKYTFLKDKILLSFVPKRVALKYIKDPEYKKEVIKLWPHHVNPINYPKDKNIMRKIYLIKKHFRYYKEYKNGYWKDLT